MAQTKEVSGADFITDFKDEIHPYATIVVHYATDSCTIIFSVRLNPQEKQDKRGDFLLYCTEHERAFVIATL